MSRVSSSRSTFPSSSRICLTFYTSFAGEACIERIGDVYRKGDFRKGDFRICRTAGDLLVFVLRADFIFGLRNGDLRGYLSVFMKVSSGDGW